MNLTLLFLWLQDQARKALEGALGGKRDEFEKWDKEIKKREEVGGGSSGGGGGWFGWGRRFGWSNGDDFWQEAQQASLAVLGIFVMVRSSLFLLLLFFFWGSEFYCCFNPVPLCCKYTLLQ